LLLTRYIIHRECQYKKLNLCDHIMSSHLICIQMTKIKIIKSDFDNV